MQNIFKMEEIMHNQLTESDIKKMQVKSNTESSLSARKRWRM